MRRALLPLARCIACALTLALHAAAAVAQTAPSPSISYRLSFPQREHRLMDVAVTFTGVPDGPLRLHMSRSSPGRYAVHQFAKNLFDLKVTDGAGSVLAVQRTAPDEWTVSKHAGTVDVSYRLFGDRLDGTYLAVDSTHAHINMPATIMWAAGLDSRAIEVRFEPPADSHWRVATQLLPGADEFTFTAPNLQYLMDSPAEFSAFDLRSFTVTDGARPATFRVAVHHSGDGGELDAFARDVEKIVRQARTVFGEFAPYDGGTYTFIADYLPHANFDAMEHRNSTVLTADRTIRGSRSDLLATVAHEFFHSWNVERIRPKSIEPFRFDDANQSGELWLAEGFTNYFGSLVMRRAGLSTTRELADDMGQVVNVVLTSPGRRVRTAEEMSQQAPFADAATAIDRTSFENTFISYYTWGQAIGLALDLTLRERTGGRATLDTFMRTMWERFGKPGGAPGYVDKPYTIDDARAVLGDGGRRSRVRGSVLRALHPGARRRRLCDAARARRPADAADESRPGVRRRPAAADVQRRRARGGGRAVRQPRVCRRSRARRPHPVDWRHRDHQRVDGARGDRAPQAGRRGADRLRAPGWRARHGDPAPRGRSARRGRHLRGSRPGAHRRPAALPPRLAGQR